MLLRADGITADYRRYLLMTLADFARGAIVTTAWVDGNGLPCYINGIKSKKAIETTANYTEASAETAALSIPDFWVLMQADLQAKKAKRQADKEAKTALLAADKEANAADLKAENDERDGEITLHGAGDGWTSPTSELSALVAKFDDLIIKNAIPLSDKDLIASFIAWHTEATKPVKQPLKKAA